MKESGLSVLQFLLHNSPQELLQLIQLKKYKFGGRELEEIVIYLESLTEQKKTNLVLPDGVAPAEYKRAKRKYDMGKDLDGVILSEEQYRTIASSAEITNNLLPRNFPTEEYTSNELEFITALNIRLLQNYKTGDFGHYVYGDLAKTTYTINGYSYKQINIILNSRTIIKDNKSKVLSMKKDVDRLLANKDMHNQNIKDLVGVLEKIKEDTSDYISLLELLRLDTGLLDKDGVAKCLEVLMDFGLYGLDVHNDVFLVNVNQKAVNIEMTAERHKTFKLLKRDLESQLEGGFLDV